MRSRFRFSGFGLSLVLFCGIWLTVEPATADNSGSTILAEAEASRLAAEAGDPKAMLVHALNLDRASGIDQDTTAAAGWVLKALEQTDQAKLGDLRAIVNWLSGSTRREIQARLQDRGYYEGEVNGALDKFALLKFKEAFDSGLPPQPTEAKEDPPAPRPSPADVAWEKVKDTVSIADLEAYQQQHGSDPLALARSGLAIAALRAKAPDPTRVPETDCDRLAGVPGSLALRLIGSTGNYNPDGIAGYAIVECERAIAAHPNEPRFKTWLGLLLQQQTAWQNQQKALELLQQAAETGESYARAWLSYFETSRAPSDPKAIKKRDELRQAAAAGELMAIQRMVPHQLETGYDATISAALEGLLATAGDAEMVVRMAGPFRADRKRTEPDLTRLAELAAAGHKNAKRVLHSYLEKGVSGVLPPSAEAAFKLTLRQGQLGDSGAFIDLARAFDGGHGVAADPVVAVDWFMTAVARGTVTLEAIRPEREPFWSEAFRLELNRRLAVVTGMTVDETAKFDGTAIDAINAYYSGGQSAAADWKLVATSDAAKALEIFLFLHRDDPAHVKLAETRLATLKAAVKPARPPVATTECDHLAGAPWTGATLALKEKGVHWRSLDAAKAIPACRDAITRHPDEPRFLAWLGRAYERDWAYADALAAYTKAAEVGEPSGMIGLGWLASEGHGVPRDPVVAAEWFAKAATAGDPEGQYIHAYTQDNFPGARVTLSDRLRQFKKSARQGHVASQLEVAIILATGDRSVAKDSAAAADLLIEALASGDHDARFILLETWRSLPADLRRQLHKRLKSLGGYAGKLNGILDAATEEAIDVIYRMGGGIETGRSAVMVPLIGKPVPLTECDRQAGVAGAKSLVALGWRPDVSSKRRRSGDGFAACFQALIHYRGEPRLMAWLGRATTEIRSYQAADQYLRRAIEFGEPAARRLHIDLFGSSSREFGSGDVRLLLALAGEGEAKAMNDLGARYEFGYALGHLGGKDSGKALSWYRKALDAGHFKAIGFIEGLARQGVPGVTLEEVAALKQKYGVTK